MSSFGKRKLNSDEDEEQYQPIPSKQLKLCTSTSADDNDVAMNDVQNIVNAVPFPTFYSPVTEASYSPSPNYTVSTLPSSSSHNSPNAYPSFDLYPEVEAGMEVDFVPARPSLRQHSSSIISQPGLMQPTSGTLHHGEGCTQIPRLRMSSHPGINGTRSMWSHCQSCGAIEMVKS